ncbi:hypothetical protein [Nonomuraea sp. NPDC049400]|uniref:hypothetical protein n=1 Tax=Nonomuraea sp. NPDC049400 TaxID=3364352 RepID=UPI0037A5F0B4
MAKRLVAGVIRDKVEAITEAVAEEAKGHAPDAKRWHATNGADARPSHRHADGQTIPATIPCRLPNMKYTGQGGGRRGPGAGPDSWVTFSTVDLADRPRDPDLPIHQRVNCECQSIQLLVDAVASPPFQAHQAGRRAGRARTGRAAARVLERDALPLHAGLLDQPRGRGICGTC